jgi:hypothetical protein
VGACLATEEAASGMTAGTHGTTFGGNPLAMAVGNAVMDIMMEPGFLDNVQQRALTLKQKLAGLKDMHPSIIEDIRGHGLMMGIKCKVPNTALQAAAMDQHLLTIGAGDNVGPRAAMKDARKGWLKGMREKDEPLEGPHAGADLRAPFDPHARVLRGGHAAVGRRDAGALIA